MTFIVLDSSNTIDVGDYCGLLGNISHEKLLLRHQSNHYRNYTHFEVVTAKQCKGVRIRRVCQVQITNPPLRILLIKLLSFTHFFSPHLLRRRNTAEMRDSQTT